MVITKKGPFFEEPWTFRLFMGPLEGFQRFFWDWIRRVFFERPKGKGPNLGATIWGYFGGAIIVFGGKGSLIIFLK